MNPIKKLPKVIKTERLEMRQYGARATGLSVAIYAVYF